MTNLSPEDRDVIARTIVGEAANQPFEGQQAVAAVILNRLRSGKYGGSISDVVFAPAQFEPWQTRKAELSALTPDNPAYGRAVQALDAATTQDNTGGATHFLEPTIVRQRRGGTLPAWAQGPSTQIGNHLFFNPGGGNQVPPRAVSEPTKSAAIPSVYGAPTPPVNPPSNLAETFLAADRSDVEPLTLFQNPPQIDRFQNSSGSEPIDETPFLPRTTRRGSPSRLRNSRNA